MKKLILCVSVLALFGCVVNKEGPDCHTALTFSNGTDGTLYADWTEPGETIASIYPIKYVSGESRKEVHVSSGSVFCIENRYKRGADFISFYVFDGEVVESNDWNSVVENNLVLQRYDLSLEDFRRLDWTLTYPPDERMKDIRMSPPYEAK
jgi:hypothetical protein